MKPWKMHLCARVPNEGARRLAWFIGRLQTVEPRAAEILAEVSLVPLDRIERLISGELLPDWDAGLPLARASGAQLGISDFYRDASGGWFDPVESRSLVRSVFWRKLSHQIPEAELALTRSAPATGRGAPYSPAAPGHVIEARP
ncbi:MAG: hypothetical protein CMN72_09565 [Sphingomonas sp.]|nr:hypothetical protein [Sphingomonas sp.]MAW99877.1 hypothetical protein [Sphingomonas sp.]